MKKVQSKIVGYLKETRAEVKKVVWPDRKYIVTATTVIIALSIIIGFFVSILDVAFAKIVLTLNQVF